MGRDSLNTMDVDTRWPYDDKVRRLQRAEPTLWPLYWSAYMGLLGEAWAKRSRKVTLEEAWVAAIPCNSVDALAALTSAGLLDRAHRIAPRSWKKWYGPAQARIDRARAAAEERWNRERKPQSASNAAALPEQSHVAVPTRQGGAELGGAKDADAVETYYSLTARIPKGPALSWIEQLTGKYGEAPVVTTMSEEWISDASLGTFLGRVEGRLGLAKHRAGKANGTPKLEERDPIVDVEAGRALKASRDAGDKFPWERKPNRGGTTKLGDVLA